MLKYLRIAVTALSLTAGAILGATWCRYYWSVPSATVFWPLFVVLALSALAALPWVDLSGRFSVRSMFIAMTLVAAAMGLIVALY